MLLLWRIWTRGDRVSWVGWVVVSVLLVYSHNWGVLFLVGENLWMVFEMLWKGRLRELWWRWLLAQVIVVVAYLPWVPIFIQQTRQLVIMGEWLHHISKFNNVLRLFNELTSLYWPRDRVYPWVLLFVLGIFTFTCGDDEFVIWGYRFEEPGVSDEVDLIEVPGRRVYTITAQSLYSGKARRSNLRFVYDLESGNPKGWTLPE